LSLEEEWLFQYLKYQINLNQIDQSNHYPQNIFL
jgi:hypothetical protein